MQPGPSRRRLLPVMAGGLLLVAGCEGSTGKVEPSPPAPPPAAAETVPLPPVSEAPLIWQPGHWDWIGVGYTWREGRWVTRAGHGTLWQPGYWTQEDGAWNWVPAHWL